MARVGDRLREERERRNKTIDDLAEASHVDRRYLEALERGDVDALPGRAFGKLYIRAYAETLGFDPQPLIEEYDREQRGPPEPREEPKGAPRPVEAAVARWREAKIAERQAAGRTSPAPKDDEDTPPAALETPAATSAGSSDPPPQRWGPRTRTFAVGAGSLLLVAVAVWLVVISRTDSDPAVSTAQGTGFVSRDLHAEPVPELVPASEARPADPEPARHAPRPASPLSIAESGVGRRVTERRLEERTDRFARGEVAWFLTQVVGGRPGESVRHVWLHGGSAVYTIELSLGGREWRTYSRATLTREGAWAVEARDAEGRVLAREELEVR